MPKRFDVYEDCVVWKEEDSLCVLTANRAQTARGGIGCQSHNIRTHQVKDLAPLGKFMTINGKMESYPLLCRNTVLNPFHGCLE